MARCPGLPRLSNRSAIQTSAFESAPGKPGAAAASMRWLGRLLRNVGKLHGLQAPGRRLLTEAVTVTTSPGPQLLEAFPQSVGEQATRGCLVRASRTEQLRGSSSSGDSVSPHFQPDAQHLAHLEEDPACLAPTSLQPLSMQGTPRPREELPRARRRLLAPPRICGFHVYEEAIMQIKHLDSMMSS